VVFDNFPADHLNPFSRYLKRKERVRHFVNIIKGFFGDSERESPEPAALAFASGGEVVNMACFMTRALFDDDGMPREYRWRLAKETSRVGGMIDDDGRDFPKKCNESAGVQRQHRGPLGKVDNCQAGVMMGHAGDKGHGLVDRRPYMPANRFNDDYTVLREQRKVPEGLRHKTKNLLASEMINEMRAAG
jgi:SRSO17 transposase